MVIKTELCAFSETRLYPGKGRRFITRTGQTVILASSKVISLYHQRKKPMLLRWTQAWRRQHKKLNVESGVKKRARRVVKVQRGYVGASLEELKKKRTTAAAPRPAPAAAAGVAPAKPGPVRQAAVAEAKAKAKAAQAARKAAGNKAAAAQPKQAAQKHAGKGR